MLTIEAFNVQEKRPELVRLIKELQPEASNRAIAEAIGVSEPTVRRDVNAASHDAPEPDEVAPGLESQAAVASHDAPEPDEADEEDERADAEGHQQEEIRLEKADPVVWSKAN
jgi:hypothetical protein